MKLTDNIIGVLMLFLALFSSLHSSAQTNNSSIGEQSNIYFRYGSSEIEPDYKDNAKSLAAIRNYIATSPQIDSIVIYSQTSPEGGRSYNQSLAESRGAAAKAFLMEHVPDKSKVSYDKIRVRTSEDDWAGLIEIVERRYKRHDRELVLGILKDDSVSSETKKWRLNRLDDGYTWSFLRRIYMPELRVSSWICICGNENVELTDLSYKESDMTESVAAPVFIIVADTEKDTHVRKKSVKSDQTAFNIADDVQLSQKKTILGLKTNLLMDAAAVLNFAVEVPIGRHFSLQYFQTFPWWKGVRNRFCLQFLTFGGEAKWWFLPKHIPVSKKYGKRNALSGHFIGLYGWGGQGDIQFGKSVCYQFDFWSAGLTYGYSLPIGNKLNLEFSLSVGYANIPYQHYIPSDDYKLLVRDDNLAGTLKYIGPTKAEVSLVIPIFAKDREQEDNR